MHPAALHMPMSSIIWSKTLSAVLAMFSKIIAFLSFQILQCNRITIVSKFRLVCLGIATLAFSHQSSVVLKLSSGIWKSAPVHALNRTQTWLVKQQCTNKCVQVSGSERHKGQAPLEGQLLLCKLSAVKHLPYVQPATWRIYSEAVPWIFKLVCNKQSVCSPRRTSDKHYRPRTEDP